MESRTRRFKKSTAKFVRSEINKTQSQSSGIARRLIMAAVLALILSFAYVALA